MNETTWLQWEGPVIVTYSQDGLTRLLFFKKKRSCRQKQLVYLISLNGCVQGKLGNKEAAELHCVFFFSPTTVYCSRRAANSNYALVIICYPSDSRWPILTLASSTQLGTPLSQCCCFGCDRLSVLEMIDWKRSCFSNQRVRTEKLQENNGFMQRGAAVIGRASAV